MKPREWWARADRLQKSRPFKIAATIAVVVVAVIVFAVYAVQRGLEATESTLGGGSAAQAAPAGPGPARGTEAAADASALGATARAMDRILAGREDLTSLAVGIGAVAGLSIMVVWLGLALTHLAIALVVLGVAWPMMQVGSVRTYGAMLLGVAALGWAFNVGLAAMRLALSGSGPVMAVARNVLSEAVRLKLSMLFIVLLIFMMATLPMLLDQATPLRHRVQAFLQYATGGAFWIIALLTLLFSVSTVTLEQRDKIIWQTMTKPVAPWQYLLGKWVGVLALNAVLLTVCCSGVFLFTEYLRSTTAVGEKAAYVPASPSERITADRLILETQVLQARRTVAPPPDFTPDDPEFRQAVSDYIESIKHTDPIFQAAETAAAQREALDAMYARMVADLYKDQTTRLRSIEPGSGRPFDFPGLGWAAARAQPLTLRYRFDAGSNEPDASYRVTIMVAGEYVVVRSCSLGYTHALPIAPVIVLPNGVGVTVDDPRFADLEVLLERGEPGLRFVDSTRLVGSNGVLRVDFANGDVTTGEVNPEAMYFPPGSVEVSYAHGGYQANFVRVAVVLWVKLAFLSMLAIAASTFLSFPVACMVAMGTFLAAESSGFLSEALETFLLTDRDNNPIYINYVIYGIASTVAAMFTVYRELDPIGRIVEGRLLSWGSVAAGVGTLGGLTALLYGAAVLVFRRRELATYSGQ